MPITTVRAEGQGVNPATLRDLSKPRRSQCRDHGSSEAITVSHHHGLNRRAVNQKAGAVGPARCFPHQLGPAKRRVVPFFPHPKRPITTVRAEAQGVNPDTLRDLRKPRRSHCRDHGACRAIGQHQAFLRSPFQFPAWNHVAACFLQRSRIFPGQIARYSICIPGQYTDRIAVRVASAFMETARLRQHR